MAQQWWENAPVVAPATEQGRPAVEFKKPVAPMSPAEEVRLNLAIASDARAAAAAERAAANDARKLEQDAKATEQQNKTLTLLTRIAGGANDIASTLAIDPEAQKAGLGETLARGVRGDDSVITRAVAGAERRTVTDAQRDMLDALLTLGTGAAYNAEQLQGQTLAYFPQYGDTEREISVKNDRLKRLIEAARINAGPLAEKFDASIAPLMKAAAPRDVGTTPATPSGMVIGAVQSGEPIMSPQDMEAGKAIQAAWDKGGNVDEVIAVAAQFGRTLRPEDIEFLRANAGKPVAINANPTGTPTAAEAAVGEFVSTPVGETIAAGAVGNANAMTFGLLDELAPVLGLDAERVQMAKRYLQERNPGASLAGEVAGSVLPGAALARGVNTVLSGTRAAGLAPVAGDALSGALAGAGEANENRLGGGLFGGAFGAGAGAAGRRVFGGGDAGLPPDGGAPMGGMPGPSGNRASGGAAATPDDVIRVSRAQELPVPVPLANFQKTRKFEDMQRARELAKNNEVGGPIRERMAQQQQAIAANFDAFIDETGAQVLGNLEEQGARITAGIRSMADKSKAKYRALYKRAQTAGETREPVSYQPVLDAIAEKLPTEQDEKVLRIAREAIGRNDPNGTGQLSIEAMEAVRKAVGSNMATDANQARLGGEVKGIIDSILDDAGGDVYRSARAAFREHQATFKDVGIIAQLLGTKRNSTDRVVAAENVVARILAPGTEAAQLRKMRDLVTGEGGDPQAWAEVQGAVMEQVRRAAYPASAVKDEAGNVAVSPAGLKRMVEKLDQSSKLSVIFDGGTAQGLRTLADVAQDVFTAPPGSLNTSNTASAWMNGLDMLVNFIGTGLPLPAGAFTNIVAPVKRAAKERPLKKEVQQLIGDTVQ